MESYSSKLLENAVNQLSRLPGIGKKTALRLALHLLRSEKHISEALGNSIIRLREDILYCQECHNISDSGLCEICRNPKRDKAIICVVEDIRDVIAIENTGQFPGVYHILGGVISPMNGIGPDDLNIVTLKQRILKKAVSEVIFALSPTIEGDTTNYYLFRILGDTGVKITSIARGIAVGNELEYTDEITLGRSILNRTPYENTIGRLT